MSSSLYTTLIALSTDGAYLGVAGDLGEKEASHISKTAEEKDSLHDLSPVETDNGDSATQQSSSKIDSPSSTSHSVKVSQTTQTTPSLFKSSTTGELLKLKS